jgi:hypothetical protein
MHTQAHGLGLYGQGSSRLGVEPQYIMQNAHMYVARCGVCLSLALPIRSAPLKATRHLLAPRELRPSRHPRIAIFGAT